MPPLLGASQVWLAVLVAARAVVGARLGALEPLLAPCVMVALAPQLVATREAAWLAATAAAWLLYRAAQARRAPATAAAGAMLVAAAVRLKLL